MTNDSKELQDFIPTESIQWASSWPKLAKKGDRRNIFAYMENRFGIKERLFDEYLLFERKKCWFLIRFAEQIEYASQLKATKVGLRAFQRVGDFVKPTTRFIQTFGRFATKGIFRITMTRLETLLGGGEIPVDLMLDNGYVILSTEENRVIGLGLCINGKIRSQLPKKEIRRQMLEMEPFGSTVDD